MTKHITENTRNNRYSIVYKLCLKYTWPVFIFGMEAKCFIIFSLQSRHESPNAKSPTTEQHNLLFQFMVLGLLDLSTGSQGPCFYYNYSSVTNTGLITDMLDKKNIIIYHGRIRFHREYKILHFDLQWDFLGSIPFKKISLKYCKFITIRSAATCMKDI